MVLAALAFAGTANAQGLHPVAAPSNAQQATSRSSTSPEDRIPELERSIEFVYAEVEALRRDQEPSAAEMIAVGTGAGVGFVLGSLTGGALVVPAVAGAATTAGFGGGLSGALATAASTVTSVGFTLGGGTVGDSLVD